MERTLKKLADKIFQTYRGVCQLKETDKDPYKAKVSYSYTAKCSFCETTNLEASPLFNLVGAIKLIIFL